MGKTGPQPGRRLGSGRGWLAGAAFALGVLIAAALVGLTVRFQLDGPARWFWILVVVATALAVLALRATGRRSASRAVLLASIIGALGWWLTIRPLGDRDWAADVAYGVTARIEGQTAILDHVRNFDWRSKQDFTSQWETRRYDISTLSSVDLATWGLMPEGAGSYHKDFMIVSATCIPL